MKCMYMYCYLWRDIYNSMYKHNRYLSKSVHEHESESRLSKYMTVADSIYYHDKNYYRVLESPTSTF